MNWRGHQLVEELTLPSGTVDVTLTADAVRALRYLAIELAQDASRLDWLERKFTRLAADVAGIGRTGEPVSAECLSAGLRNAIDNAAIREAAAARDAELELAKKYDVVITPAAHSGEAGS